MTLRHAAATIAAGLAIASCTVEVDLEGKACPCASEYECDTARNVCVERVCAASATNIAVLWSTPNTIAVRWESTGDPDSFLKYELFVSESESDVTEGAVVPIGEDTNPELASYFDGDSTTKTAIIGGLEPNTIYFVGLSVTDSASCETRLAALQKRTAPPHVNDPIPIFPVWDAESGPPGVNTWDEVTLQNPGPEAFAQLILTETGCISENEDGSNVCGQPVKMTMSEVIGMSTGALNRVKSQELPNSFLEVTVEYTAIADLMPPPAHTGKVWMRFQQQPGDFNFVDFTIAPRPGDQTLVLPLTALVASPELADPGAPLSHDVLVAGPVTEIGLSAQWAHTGVVRVRRIQVLH